MEITEVRVKLRDDSDNRLRAICSITIDDAFVVRDLKVIERESGLFVAMPSRKLTAYCSHCGRKNQLRVVYCNQCGRRFEEAKRDEPPESADKMYADIAHPINASCREAIERTVIYAYKAEKAAIRSGRISQASDPVEKMPQTKTTSATHRRIDPPAASSAKRRPLIIDSGTKSTEESENRRQSPDRTSPSEKPVSDEPSAARTLTF